MVDLVLLQSVLGIKTLKSAFRTKKKVFDNFQTSFSKFKKTLEVFFEKHLEVFFF